MRRLFSDRQRVAIATAAGFRCEQCGRETPLEEGHADHAVSWKDGGATRYGNARWLCAACNLRKGRDSEPRGEVVDLGKPPLPSLYRWQAEALAQQQSAAKTGKRFFVAAGVGTGKTRAALAMYLAGPYDLIVILSPKSGIAGGWADTAGNLGLRLKQVTSSGAFRSMAHREELPIHGLALTTSMLQSVIADMALVCERHRTLVVYDEAHHLYEDGAWTDWATEAFAAAAFHVGLSGTPYRDDDRRIHTLDYLSDGVGLAGVPHVEYSAEEAAAEGNVAPVVTRYLGGYADWNDGRGLRRYDYSEDYDADDRRMGTRLRLTAVDSLGWQLEAIAQAVARLQELRVDGNPWAGLVACRTVAQAERLADAMAAQGHKVLRVYGRADTAEAVRTFNSDTSYDWLVSITKVSEGINIDRLRVAVLLTNVTTRSFFDQLRGRLMRLLPEIPQPEQTAVVYIPADPRLKKFAEEAQAMTVHYIEQVARRAERLDTQERLRQLALILGEETETMDLGGHIVDAKMELIGGLTADGISFTEDEWHERRLELLEDLGPLALTLSADFFREALGMPNDPA